MIVTRSSTPFASPQDATRACSPMLMSLDTLGRERYWLLLDSRQAVGNNSPGYEAWFARFRKDLVRGFPRTAVLVRTQVGTLQSRRLLEADRAAGHSEVFCDLSAAIAYLRVGIRRSSIPSGPASDVRTQPLQRG